MGHPQRFDATQGILVALCMLIATAASPQSAGTSLGLRGGGLIGSTELTDKPHLQASLALRRPLIGILLWELSGGYARLDGTQYATNLTTGELRLLLAKRSGTLRPVVYAGGGATRYNLATSPPGRTPDIDGLGVALTVPVGLGFQWMLGGGTKAVEILGGYTYTLQDDINGSVAEPGNDVLWGLTVGLTFGGFGPRAAPQPAPVEAAPPAPPQPAPAPRRLEVPPPVAAPPMEPSLPEPAPVEEPAAPIAVEPAPREPLFAPVYFATGSARLSPNGQSLIAEIARTLERLDEVVLLEARGYADARGARSWNRKLAMERAAAVKAALVAEGIAPWRIRAVAVGETEAVPGEVWRGRRVEIVELE